MINVNKTYLPPFEEYAAVLRRAWDKGWITNNGELLVELENQLKNYLGVDHLLICANGTIVLQMALKALNITKEVITTPFSYVATVNAIIWEGCTPVFVDIRPDTFCIDENKIEAAITENTQAILATHVYGYPCNVEAIQKIADQYKLKVIYDGAHAFGCKFKGKSLLSFGDITTCSFHATKIFHTVEGGALVCKDHSIFDKLRLYRQFGHFFDEYFSIGINAKNSELHAAMGLCMLPRIAEFIEERKRAINLYNNLLISNTLRNSFSESEFDPNYGYYLYLFDSEEMLVQMKSKLESNGVFTRRYFYPALNTLPYLRYNECKVAESISKRILALPLFNGIAESDIIKIASIINTAI